MPYVDQATRGRLRWSDKPNTTGELNYVITHLIHNYLDDKGIDYMNLNAVIGVLECAKMELYRRVASPYEDSKVLSNGDVLPVSMMPREAVDGELSDLPG